MSRDHKPLQYAGPSILDILWKELMTITARLYEGELDPRDRGRAEGLASAIAVIENPYAPSIDSVRAEVVRRWRDRS